MSIGQAADAEKKTESVGSITITTRHKWYRFDKRIRDFVKKLDFSAPYRKRFLMQNWVYFAFFAQGLLGILTLTIFSRNLTSKPSAYLASATGTCQAVKKYKKEEAKAKEDNVEFVPSVDAYANEDEELEAFLERFSAEKEYDKQGKYIGKK